MIRGLRRWQRGVVHLHVSHGTGFEILHRGIGLLGRVRIQLQPPGIAEVDRSGCAYFAMDAEGNRH
jgi:hypothetical protein